MTAIDDAITSEGTPLVSPRRRTWPRVAIAFVVGFVVCLLIAGGALLAHDASLDGRVLPGVSVNGVDLSGLDRAGATTALTGAFGHLAEGRVVVRTTAGDVAIPFADFARRAEIDAMVDEALRTGRSGTLIERAVAEVRLAMNGVSMAPRFSFDKVALAAKIRAALAAQDRAPVDSTVTMTPTSIYTTPASTGRVSDPAAAVDAAVEAVGALDAPSEVVIEAPGVEIPPAHGDVEALVAKAAAERWSAISW